MLSLETIVNDLNAERTGTMQKSHQWDVVCVDKGRTVSVTLSLGEECAYPANLPELPTVDVEVYARDSEHDFAARLFDKAHNYGLKLDRARVAKKAMKWIKDRFSNWEAEPIGIGHHLKMTVLGAREVFTRIKVPNALFSPKGLDESQEVFDQLRQWVEFSEAAKNA